MPIKVHTRKGDYGITHNYSGEKISKSSSLIEVIGKIDEFQSSLNMSLSNLNLNKDDCHRLIKIHKKLRQLAGELSLGLISKNVKDPITKKDIVELEVWINQIKVDKPIFIIFNSTLPSLINESRVRCRSLERWLTKSDLKIVVRHYIRSYINRLSDYLFVLAYFYQFNLSLEGDNNEKR